MANIDFGHGLSPKYDLISENIPQKIYAVDSAAATVYPGDLVKMETDGYAAPSATTNVNNIGVAGSYHLTGTAGTVVVYNSPYTVFAVQVNGGTLDIACLGSCADLDTSEGPDTVRKLSGHQCSSTVGAGTAQLKILGLCPTQDTYTAPANAYGANQVVLVLINEHLLKDTAGI